MSTIADGGLARAATWPARGTDLLDRGGNQRNRSGVRTPVPRRRGSNRRVRQRCQIGETPLEQLAPFGPVLEFTFELDEGEDGVARIFAFALEALGGRLDVLLHVAGISGRKFGDGPMHDCTREGWERVLRTNAEGAFLTNRAAVRQMLDQPIDSSGLRGTVVNVGSVVDRSPSPAHFGTIAYAASKGAVRAMTLAAAARYAADRIRFNLLAPGLIDTPMAARATNDSRIRNYLGDQTANRRWSRIG